MDSQGQQLPDELIYISEWEGSPQVAMRHLGRYLSIQLTTPIIRGNWLDCACGSGYGSSLLAVMGATSVLGVDKNPGAIGYAKAAFKSPRVSFLRKDILKAEHWLRDKYDGMACIETLEHLNYPDQVEWVMRASKFLRTDGVFHVCSPIGQGGPNPLNPFHLYEPTEQELTDLLESFFLDVNIWTEEYDSTAGEEAIQAHATATKPRRS